MIVFSVNLTQVYETATYDSEYAHLPVLCKFQVSYLCILLLNLPAAAGAPDMAELRNQIRSIDRTQHGPYFRGYCGEHESEYHGITQLAGNSFGEPLSLSIFTQFNCISVSSMQTRNFDAHVRRRGRLDEESQRVRANILPPRPTSLAYTRIRGCRNASAGPSGVHVYDLGVPSVREQEVIDRLHAGEGVLGTEMNNLFEKCTVCDLYFVASLLRVHIRGCMN
jgi:hypothetical protein